MEVTLQQILDAREDRVKKQKELLEKYKKPLVCFTMNIAGPVKLDRDIVIGFYVGKWLLTQALGARLLYSQEQLEATGCEGFYAVDMPAKELKRLTADIEDDSPVGRLFDMDVLDTDGKKLERDSLGCERRKCLLCDKDAALCARSRAHSVAQLQDRTGFLLYTAARQYMAEYVAVRAYLALMQEVSATPKPGLVDRNNRGSHTDMGIKHFLASANALRPFFCRFTEEGFLTRDDPPEATFRRIRSIGMEAEKAMLQATHGVNTHKGAIFSLGILCAAAGRLSPEDWQAEKLLNACKAMTKGLAAQDFSHVTCENATTPGERFYAQYGIAGIRGQAEAGFPAVSKAGLPILQQALNQGLSLNDAGCVTLLHLLAATDDTNLIHRSDRQTQLQVKEKIADLLKKEPFPTIEVIEELDRDFIQKNLSPGGSADLLAVTYFLYFLQQ